MMNNLLVVAAVIIFYFVVYPLIDFIISLLSFSRKKDISYFFDRDGRIKVYHGVNVCNYSKWNEDNLPWHTEKDYEKLKEYGFNLVRFVIFWAAIEPERGIYNNEYISKVKGHISILNKLGIDVILDLHQDLYNKKFSGNGFPDWALPEGDLPFKPKKKWYLNYFQKSVIKSYSHFWKSESLRSSYIDMLCYVQNQFVGTNNVIGIDVMNEPFPKIPPLLFFESCTLYNFYQRIDMEMKEKRAVIPMYYEPAIYTSAGIPTKLCGRVGMTLKKFIPHYYPPFCHYEGTYNRFNKFLMSFALKCKAMEASKMHSPYIIGEFGIAPEVKKRFAAIKDFLTLSDKYAMSWIWWSYDKIGHDIQGLLDNDGNPNLVMESLTRAYPQRISGTKPKWYNDGDRFYLEYIDNDVKANPTEIYIPGKIIDIISNTSFVLDNEDRGVRKFYTKEKGKQKIEIIWRST